MTGVQTCALPIYNVVAGRRYIGCSRNIPARFNEHLRHLHAGYHDYQHLVKDFQQFAGATPPQMLAENEQAPEKRLGLA